MVCILLTVFGGELYGSLGSVASPYYPRDYPHRVTYTWTVTVSLGSLVMASFQTMDLEAPWRGNCVYDYVKVGYIFIGLLRNEKVVLNWNICNNTRVCISLRILLRFGKVLCCRPRHDLT